MARDPERDIVHRVAAARSHFRSLHQRGEPLLLVNAWDRSSAVMMELAGAVSIGTTSFGIACSRGFPDGEHLPWHDALDVTEQIVHAVSVPVTADVESGRGRAPQAVATTVAGVAQVGVAGINLEDTVPGTAGLLPIAEQVERLAAARESAGADVFINARCDSYFTAEPPPRPLEETLRRAELYAAAGADGLFVPGLLDLRTIKTLTGSTPLPVNVMAGPGAPHVDDLAAAGVSRISQGGWAFAATLGFVERLTQDFVRGKSYGREGDADPAFHRVADLVR